MYREKGNTGQSAVLDLQFLNLGHVSKPQTPNDNANIFIRMYSAWNKMGKTHSKHCDEATM